MILKASPETEQKMLELIRQDNVKTVLCCYRGSHAHGTYRSPDNPDSIDDTDFMSFVVPDKSCYLGLNDYGSRGTVEIKHEELDIVNYEMRKAVNLIAGCNPNMIAALWCDSSHYVVRTPETDALIWNRDLFSTKLAYKTFCGYATEQLKKMTNNATLGYMGAKRKQLVEKFGYDSKNSSHLIRLLRMGTELLETGLLRVERSSIDAQELISIKKGEWSLEQVKNESDRMFVRLEEAHKTSKLPERPDMNKINELCVSIVSKTLNLEGK